MKLFKDITILVLVVCWINNSHIFAAGNFKALFEAIEQEQAKRGTLTDTPAEFTPKTQ